jgi:hypothetical protein
MTILIDDEFSDDETFPTEHFRTSTERATSVSRQRRTPFKEAIKNVKSNPRNHSLANSIVAHQKHVFKRDNKKMFHRRDKSFGFRHQSGIIR